MGYVGNQAVEGYSSIPAKQDLTGATGTSLTLTHPVSSAESIDLFINNVRQEPTTAYTVAGTTVTLTGSVIATDDIYVVYNGLALQTVVPPDGSVTSAKLASDAVTTAKIQDGAVTSAKLAGLTSSDMPTGSVLQVVQTVKSDTFSTTSTTWVDITGLSASITPSSTSSKIMVEFHIGAHTSSTAASIKYKIVRGTTDIGVGDSGNGDQVSVGVTIDTARGETASMKYLDSPATTSATTYKIQMEVGGGTVDINKRSAVYGAISTITLTEIAG